MDDQVKPFRQWDVMEGRREIFSPEESLPQDDLVFFLLDLIPRLDLIAFYSFYSTDLRGQPPFNVPMMVTLLVYAYSVGVFSSRKIAGACERNLAFLAIVGNDCPDFRTISDFRKNHQAAMKPLQAEIDQLLENAERTDAEQDAALGSRRGDELPAELQRREDRIAKIQEAKARLEAEAQVRAEAQQRERDAAQAEREAAGKSRRGKPPAPIDPTPEDKAQTNFTDPEAKIMKQSNKGFDYSYNSQIVVDSEHQIIVAAEVTTAANDQQQAVPLAQAALDNLAAASIALPRDANGQPRRIPNTADTGYYSESNVTEVTAMGLDPYYATGRQKHHPSPAAAASEAPASSATKSPKELMAEKLRTESGRKLYAARKHIVEPVFGQIKSVRGFRKYLLRGWELVSAEWQLVCLTHNLLKIWRHQMCPR